MLTGDRHVSSMCVLVVEMLQITSFYISQFTANVHLLCRNFIAAVLHRFVQLIGDCSVSTFVTRKPLPGMMFHNVKSPKT